ncbi:hypothetical protein [Actomonas aquatica]|uniref:Secreted protein n=1 Tax=Actomonas aquatica TaxID=2866162 RepID=A0ABZ1CC92_9BACT|nr:hypothetical protein [Opitutus sp. WL0086]WRQ89292.1 hypothetical protein K1X11_007720 [Opitutus sp. WL0086]
MRSPIVRGLAFLVALLLALVVGTVAVAVLLPLLGVALAVGAIGTGAFLLNRHFRRGQLRAKPRAENAPPPGTTEVIDEDTKLARAKPVERV